MKRRQWLVVAVATALVGGCSGLDAETRAREAADKIKASIADLEARALEQKVDPADVKAAQAVLTTLNEYQGEVNGQLDAVTVNSIEAFQRAKGLRADGILNEQTKRLLQEAAGKDQS
ncbi:MAG: peptidoglycan-binding protein [Deltaproteobacteria bacterium]|nr:peptidoglycan-binding protein [Deltaproteobacteria bacterium]